MQEQLPKEVRKQRSKEKIYYDPGTVDFNFAIFATWRESFFLN